ncbi:MAG: hypothetical protein WC872_03270 [Candidatus Absconditabacterales bacterium]|jgi:hypothetical protein
MINDIITVKEFNEEVENDGKKIESLLEKQGFCLIEIDKKLNENPSLRKIQNKDQVFNSYTHFVVTTNGEGYKNFANKYHRNTAIIDHYCLPKNKIPKIFSEKESKYLLKIYEKFGPLHIKGALNPIKRKK